MNLKDSRGGRNSSTVEITWRDEEGVGEREGGRESRASHEDPRARYSSPTLDNARDKEDDEHPLVVIA